MYDVCSGNICRSPAAEAVFRNLVSKRGLESKFQIDSAGTIGYHEVIFYTYLVTFLMCTVNQFSDGIRIDDASHESREIRPTQGWYQLPRSGGLRWPQYPGLSNPQISEILILSLQWTGRIMVISQLPSFVSHNLRTFVDVLPLNALIFWPLRRRHFEFIWQMATQGDPPR